MTCESPALMCSIASSRGKSPASAKKQACIGVLIRAPKPVCRATSYPSTTKNRSRFGDDLLLYFAGQLVPHAVGRDTDCLAGTSLRRAATLQNIDRFQQIELVARDKIGLIRLRYVDRIGRGLKRKCETVMRPISSSRKQNIPGQTASVFSPMIFTEFLLAPTRAVAAQSIKHGALHVIGFSGESSNPKATELSYVVIDANSKMTFRPVDFEVRTRTPMTARICPIETPEGPNIGLINSLATFARVNKYGFVRNALPRSRTAASPMRRAHLSAMEEGRYHVAQANVALDNRGRFTDDLDRLPPCRRRADDARPTRSTIMDVSPKQLVSVAAALIPFLENDDANRALMGSNMQRQAVPAGASRRAARWSATGTGRPRGRARLLALS